jgi:hypothetical protein
MEFPYFRKFREAETGAVTTDWTIITAAITGLGIAATAALFPGISSLSDDVEVSLTNYDITATLDPSASSPPALLGLKQAVYDDYVAAASAFTNKKLLNQLNKLSAYAAVTSSGTAQERRKHDKYNALLALARSRGLK